ncbi:hypothetical protein KCU89_g8835, partial [Aureobasidium melanogenum]
LAQAAGMDTVGGDMKLQPTERLRRQRIYALLYISERGACIHDTFPVSILSAPKLLCDKLPGEDPAISTGLSMLFHLFSLLDLNYIQARSKLSLSGGTDKEYIELAKLQEKLCSVLNLTNVSEIQRADVLITQQWLRLMVWQTALRLGLISSKSMNPSYSYAYPMQIAASLHDVLKTLPSATIEVHGLGIFEKQFEIAYSLLDALTLSDGTQSPHHHEMLRSLLESLSASPKSRDVYVRILQNKMGQENMRQNNRHVHLANVQLLVDDHLNQRDAHPVECVTGPIALSNGGSIEQFEEAESNMANESCSTLNLINKQCDFDPNLVRTLVYQSIADVFGKLVQGSVGLGGHTLPYPEVTYNSNIAQTVLLDTNELSFIQTWSPNSGFLDLVTLSDESNGTSYVDLSDNITLSLLSEQYLQPNYSSPYAPPPNETVTFTTYHNVYVYNNRILWIAYGIATGSTLIAVAIGTAALLSNGSACSNNFSTVLRIKKTMSEEILEKEGDGSEPLPKRLARARVQLGDSREQLAEKASVSSSVTLIDQPEATAYSSLLRTNTRRIL